MSNRRLAYPNQNVIGLDDPERNEFVL